jgi:cobalt-zinc-cadmium efflux system membrane fusion protein
MLLMMVVLSTACQKKTESGEGNDENQSIEISSAQFEMAEMELGHPLGHVFRESTQINGYVKAAPEGKAQITVLMPGRVKKVHCTAGQFVEKGTALFELEGFEIIQLQQEFAQSDASLHLAATNLMRVESLSAENIAAKRELQIAQSEHQSLRALHEALSQKLQLMGLHPADVAAGTISSSIDIKSPIRGYLTQQLIEPGQYLEPQQMAMEIIHSSKLQLELQVFAKDLSSLAQNQKVLFYDPDMKDQKYEAHLQFIGKTIDKQSKTIQCIAYMNDEDKMHFVDGMYVECEIITSERQSMAIPTQALIKDGYNHYVLVKSGEEDDKILFSKVEIEIGREELEYTEIITEGLNDILLKGVYNLAGEE